MDKTIKVKIIDNNIESSSVLHHKAWYNIGEKYDVVPYRHNPEMYWECAGWGGNLYGAKFWILKRHTVIVYDTIKNMLDIPDELFEL